MELFDAIDPAELTGYVRARLADLEENQFRLSQWLPNRPVNDLQYRFVRGGLGLIEAGEYRTYDTESPIGAREGVVRVTGELPPISRKIRLGEFDHLRLRNLDAEIEQGIFNDAGRMVEAIAARVELARGEAFVDGSLAIDENGVEATVDFGRDADHEETAGTAWTDNTSGTPLDDLDTWAGTMEDNTGVRPSIALISRTRLIDVLQNDQITGALGAVRRADPPRATTDEVNDLFASHDLPRLVVFEEKVNVAGSATRVIGADKLILLPEPGSVEASQLGDTFYGITAEAQEHGDKIVGGGGDLPGVVALAWRKVSPVARWTEAVAITLPVLANPDLSFAATI